MTDAMLRRLLPVRSAPAGLVRVIDAMLRRLLPVRSAPAGLGGTGD